MAVQEKLIRFILSGALALATGCGKPSEVPEGSDEVVKNAALWLGVEGSHFCSAAAIEAPIEEAEGLIVIATAYHCRRLIDEYRERVTIGNSQGEVPFPYEDYTKGMSFGEKGADVVAFATHADLLPPGTNPLPACNGIPVGGTEVLTVGYSGGQDSQIGPDVMYGVYQGVTSGNLWMEMPGGGTFTTGAAITYNEALPKPGNSGSPIVIYEGDGRGDGRLCVLAVFSSSPRVFGAHIGAFVAEAVQAAAGSAGAGGERTDVIDPTPTPVVVRKDGKEICVYYASGVDVDVRDLFEELRKYGDGPYVLVYGSGGEENEVRIGGGTIVDGALPAGLLIRACVEGE